jgi:hypothetical protein
VTTRIASANNAGGAACIVTTADEADRLCLATFSALRSRAVTDCAPTTLGGRQSLAAAMRLRRDLGPYDAARGIGRLGVIRNALDSLRGKSSRETMKAATALLCRDLGFTRVMVSTVREHDWLPRYVHGRGAAVSVSFQGFSIGMPVRFEDSEAESALVRGRHGDRHAAC